MLKNFVCVIVCDVGFDNSDCSYLSYKTV